jgi:hypothetical protein
MFHGKSSPAYFLLLLTALFVCTPAGWLLAGTNPKQSAKKSNSKTEAEKTTDEVFKNIKVLNGQPASQLGPTMHFFEAALGFNCGNCHVKDASNKWAFEKDDKPEKRRARAMVTMMNDINKINFKGEQLVTCFTCHRGTPDPEPVPAVITASALNERRNERNEDEEIKVPNRLGGAEEIISKYEQAIGGKDAFDKITSLKMEANIKSGNGPESSIVIFEKAPNLYYSETKSPQGVTKRGFNGETGWFKAPWYSAKVEGEDLQDLKLASDFYAPLNFEKNYSGLKLDNVDLIDNDTVYSVVGTAGKYRRYKFFFDTKSGLLIRQIQYNKTITGELQTRTDYKDYRNINGVMYPFEIDVADYENIQQFKFDAITPNVVVDEKMFDMPDK